ncbi:barstar family protein [Paenibacillus apiarius]|uniref:Barstar family protein n=1 Tax=Paenibacillus apiarius TaxID=46240 RepID=A0ABT4E2F9_9BACL|nr:barstar family protein [Paenibacillus apiarius]MBN3527187.1 barstar family protein [Paenibacillus apiarius]MCY9514984.1 barstar family protein [Paenibacillus apiarius]MCY9522421.1 barstar family protein [Paenibacillus apiarius]MCY9552159.1 barstar family protein [Paenibacillus apiarius]MCY9561054.1 barstar family protein [Paenibacillus apiarius]
MRTIILDGQHYATRDQLHDELKEKLALPDYYGRNLDALWDCLTGWVELPLTIQWTHFEQSERHLGDYSHQLVELFREAEEELAEFHLIVKQ